jgi:hypothetical protein
VGIAATTEKPIAHQNETSYACASAMTAVLKNAELRGEIRLEKLTPRLISLPLNLLQYELITKLEPISDEAIAEIVDDIFLPLVYARSGIIKRE